VRDANLTANKDKASFTLLRNDTTFKQAALTIDTFKVDTTASSNYFRQSPPDFLRPGQNHAINLVYSPNTLNFTTSLVMPDTFSVIINGNHLYRPGDPLPRLDWSGSGNAGGYLVVSMHSDPGQGSLVDTSFFLAFGINSTSIPAEAFRDDNGAFVEGVYHIFVVSFRGGLFPYSGMPFVLPFSYAPAETTYTQTVSGRITSAFVARFDTLKVSTVQ